jgi:putative protease
LDQILGPRTDRLYPELPADTLPINAEQALAMTFQRKSTSFFTTGRYVENVIDLDNPSHRGILAGTVTQIRDDKVKVRLEVALDRFDGVRLAPDAQVYRAKPQHDNRAGEDTTVALKQRYDNEELSFSVRSMWREVGKGQTLVPTAKEADTIWLQLPEEQRLRPAVGWKLWRVRSNEIKQWSEQMAKLPAGIKPKPWRMVDLELTLADQELTVALIYGSEKVAARSFVLEGLQASDNDTLTAVLREAFQVFGDAGIKAESLELRGAEHKFLPMSQVKQLKRAVVAWLSTELMQQDQAALAAASEHLTEGYAPLKAADDCQFIIKVDDLVTAERSLSEAFAQGLRVTELVFEPKRSRLEQAKPDAFLNELERLATTYQVAIRLAFPLVTRAWDEPLLKRWFQAYAARFAPRYEVGNIGCFDLLRSWGLVADLAVADISSDFSLYALNRESVAFLADKGVTTTTLSIEDDATDIASLCQHWPKDTKVVPQVVLYKDTPLFIAEACSLTALHNGCPSSKVCGYRTLHIENKAGERFYVAHENCKSIVYGEQAFALSHQRQTFERMGIRRFRLDFLTRPFTAEQVSTIIAAVTAEKRVPETHTANFERRLL